MKMAPPYVRGRWYHDGQLIEWIAPEHCLLLVGYDDNNYIFNDPQYHKNTYYAKSAVEAAYAGMKSQAVVVEKNASVSGVSIDNKFSTLTEGDVRQLSVTVTPQNANNKNVIWSSSDSKIATVDSDTGKLTARTFGKTKITVTTIEAEYTDSFWLYVDSIQDGELTIYSCITESSSVGFLNTKGHSWITFKNMTHTPTNILGVVVSPGREVSFGAWGLPNMPRKGLWVGLEAFQVAEQGKNTGRVSLTIPLYGSEIAVMASSISEFKDYSLSTYNCATMAVQVWNSVAQMDMKLFIGLPLYTTPQTVVEAIQSMPKYETGRGIQSPNTEEIGYPSPEGFVAVGEEDWRLSYRIYEYILNLFSIL